MRTVARVALVVTTTAILMATLATPGARADKGRRDEAQVGALMDEAFTAPQQPRQQQRPDRFEYSQSTHVVIVASAVARVPPAPEVASLKTGDEQLEGEKVGALAAVSDQARNRSIDPTLEVMESTPERLQAQDREPAPVVFKFDVVVININFAGFGG